jgi:hypothetical protein
MYFVEKTTDSGVEYYILDLLFDYTIVEHGFLLYLMCKSFMVLKYHENEL